MTDSSPIDRFSVARARSWPGYVVAVLSTLATLWIRVATDASLGGQPNLVVFTVPIMLSAYVGGLGPGLIATLLAYLGASYFLLPPIHSFLVQSAGERWQQALIALAGVVISVLNEALHRARRRADAAVADQKRQYAAILDSMAERERAEEQRARLSSIVESSGDAIIGKTLDGVITSWNAGAQRVFGYSATEAVGQSLLVLFPAERTDEELRIRARIAQGELVDHFETVRVRKDGTRIDVSVTIAPIVDAFGRILGASKIARDISSQKQRERELVRLARAHASLSGVNQAIVRSADRGELLGRVCRALVEGGSFTMAWIGQLDSETGQVLPVGRYGDDSNYLAGASVHADERAEGHDPVGMAIRADQTYVCNDISADPRVASWLETAARAGFRASAVVPIRTQGLPWGSLNAYASEIDAFGDREIALLDEAARDVSFAFDNFAREEARRGAEDQLRESEARLFTAFSSCPVGLSVNRLSDRMFIDVNAAFSAITGWARDEAVGRTTDDLGLVHVDDLGEIRSATTSYLPLRDVELSIRTRSGELRHVLLGLEFADLRGEKHTITTFVDITERKLADRQIRDQRDELLRWQDVMMNREDRVQSLKSEVNELLGQQREPPRYATFVAP